MSSGRTRSGSEVKPECIVRIATAIKKCSELRKIRTLKGCFLNAQDAVLGVGIANRNGSFLSVLSIHDQKINHLLT